MSFVVYMTKSIFFVLGVRLIIGMKDHDLTLRLFVHVVTYLPHYNYSN